MMSYYAKLTGEDLSRCLNKIPYLYFTRIISESVGVRKA